MELNIYERQQLFAYKSVRFNRISLRNVPRRAWIALWILVALIVATLWILVICVALRRCAILRAKPYDNIIVTKTQGFLRLFPANVRDIGAHAFLIISGDNTVAGRPISTTARLA